MNSEQANAHVCSYLRNDPVLGRGAELLKVPYTGLPLSICAPFHDFLESEQWGQFLKLEQMAELQPVIKLLGNPLKWKPARVPDEAKAALLHLSRVLDATGGSEKCCTRPAAKPEVVRFEAVDDALDCCARSGETIDSAAPGTFVRIVGSRFDPTREGNSVRFGNDAASILKASEDQLVVMVPVVGLGMKSEKTGPAYKKGRVKVTVSTSGGEETAEFTILELPEGDPAALREWSAGVTRVLGKLQARLGANQRTMERSMAAERSGAVRDLYRQLPVLSAGLAGKLDALPSLAALAGRHRSKVEKMIAGVLESSRALIDLKQVEDELDDPTSNLLEGSGLVETICTIHEWVLKVIAVILAVILVLLIILIAFVLLAIATAETVVSEFIIVPIIIAIVTIIDIAIKVLYVAILVEVVVTIIYIVAKALQYVGEFLSWAFGSDEEEEQAETGQ